MYVRLDAQLLREAASGMSMRDLERLILEELRDVSGRPKLRLKDMQEWSTGPLVARDGETVFRCPKNMVNVAILTGAALPGKRK